MTPITERLAEALREISMTAFAEREPGLHCPRV